MKGLLRTKVISSPQANVRSNLRILNSVVHRRILGLCILLLAPFLQNPCNAENSLAMALNKGSRYRNDHLLLKPRYGTDKVQLERLHAEHGCRMIRAFPELG